jgi:hypothetical protein
MIDRGLGAEIAGGGFGSTLMVLVIPEVVQKPDLFHDRDFAF